MGLGRFASSVSRQSSFAKGTTMESTTTRMKLAVVNTSFPVVLHWRTAQYIGALEAKRRTFYSSPLE